MAWNTMGVFARTDEPVARIIEALGYPAQGAPVAIRAEQATSSHLPGIAAGRVGEWLALWSPRAFVPGEGDGIWGPRLHRAFVQLSGACPVFTVLLAGVADVHGFAAYERGALVRAWLSSQGEVSVSVGTPLAEEALGPETSPEAFVLGLVERKVGAPWNAAGETFLRYG